MLLFFSYYRLINVKYENRTAKAAMAKRLAREKNISVREAEQWLDANVYLEEQWKWMAGRLHHEYLCQQMFAPAATTGWSEHDCAIHWGWRKPSPEWDLAVEPTAMELVHPNSTHEDIGDLYQDVYQLQRLPRRGQWENTTKKCLCEDILDSLKECLWLKQPSAQPQERHRQMPANITWPDGQLEFVVANPHIYEEFMALKEDSCEGMLAMVRDAHHQALAVAAKVEDKIERLSHSITQQHSSSCWCYGSCWHSGSHWHRWSRSAGHWGIPQATSHCRVLSSCRPSLKALPDRSAG